MDMERIKQNLRLRSGRSKVTSKKFPTAPRTQTSNSGQTKDFPQLVPAKQEQQRLPQTTASTQPKPGSSSKPKNQETGTSSAAKPTSQKRKPTSDDKPSLRPNGIVPLPPDARPKTERTQFSHYASPGIEHDVPQAPQSSTPKPATAMTAKPNNANDNDKNPSSDEDFDLRPSNQLSSNSRSNRPGRPSTSIDSLCTLLFSAEHLHILLHDPTLMTRFSAFLQRYRPDLSAVVLQYLQYQKAIKAVEYANAVAASIDPIAATMDGKTSKSAGPASAAAAELSRTFASSSKRTYDLLVHEALPAYIAAALVKLATECLVAEITGSNPTSLTANLLGGLSEVFCLSDPKLPDNPLIYCSEEFYRLTGYAREDVLGRNCRFLQGANTSRESVKRIGQCVARGEGCVEVVLNYRRDGRGFVNVLMIAPLEDEKGNVKYFLGAQVDASRLVAGGWGLDGLQRLVAKRELEEMRGRRVVKGKKDEALKKLGELSEMFDLEESAVVRSHSRSSSVDRGGMGSGATSAGGSDRPLRARRVFGDDGEAGSGSEDESDTETEETQDQKETWKLATSGTSGKLPGVYQKYLLIRPSPSLRIIFVSPALRRRSNIAQKPFLSHIAAPAATLSGLKDSFLSGTPVTAKIAFMPEPGSNRDGTQTGKWRKANGKIRHDQYGEQDPSSLGRTCWISATPLMGDDDEVGVWMIVLVDKRSAPSKTLSKTKGKGMEHQQLEGRVLGIEKANERNEQIQALSDDFRKDDLPLKPVRVGATSAEDTPRREESPSPAEDREAAREMYDKDDNDGVQQEAKKGLDQHAGNNNNTNAARTSNLNDKTLNTHQPDHGGAHQRDDEQEPRYMNTGETTEIAGFEHVPKANGVEDELTAPTPTEVRNDQEHPDGLSALQEAMTSSHNNDNADPSESRNEDVAHHRDSRSLTPTRTRLVIGENDSSTDLEKEPDIESTADSSFPGKQDLYDEDEESTPPGMKHKHTHHHHHGQPEQDDDDEEDEDEDEDESETLRPGTSDSRASLYMDYLRHPGSKKKKRPEGMKTPSDSDPDCEVWSPYSVD